ncbi:ATP-binding protein [Streptomyces sp. ME02-6979-3A]|uniref:ATP-binding protein n=1 Tax=Streptomyces silvae TaxID=2803812 RepID=A0ABU8A7J7_9ACTN|nr:MULTISPECIES: ATP-binding protein [unclassified Streptomyces]MDX3324127.1 ATP-binding protein [Streptomyces sp. ME02-6979-3A]MDX3683017.1 ATP-binding protein [Streptomyces sp. AK04-4c]
MDPINRGPEEYGHGTDRPGDDAGRRRQSRDPLTPDLGHQTPQPSRTVQLISGDFLLTVNPVDGSEIEPCRPGERPDAPVRHTAARRVERERAAAPPVPPGPPAPQMPLLERQEERERLVRLLARGRSVCLTGPAGSGRTALLDAVAADCADLAPDGVVRLSGYKRSAAELLHALFEAVYSAPLHRPDREQLLSLVHGIGAVVVVDDLELGGAALQELLDATPECAFLFAATPDVSAPAADANLEEVFLTGLDRGASIALMEHVVERALTDEEANWAGDLWFESEGLPLRFVQAGALLRQRDDLRAGQDAFDGYEDDPADAPFGRVEPAGLPLPSLGEGAAPAALLASRLSEAARETLRFAVALGGEVPHQAHLPALVGDTHADAALGELALSGLLSPAGPRYRLAAGVLAQLEASGYDESADAHARSAAQHYSWWAGHPSVTPERAVAEADALLASMSRLVPGEAPGQASVAVLLARSAAPAFAAGMQWGAWEKALRAGLEAARIAGEVAEEAYFHHELGVLALCAGQLDRARAELEASIGMRGALADKPGAVAGRRALALVADRSGEPLHSTPAGEEVPAPRHDESASPPAGVPEAKPLFPRLTDTSATLIARQEPPLPGPSAGRMGVIRGARRNLVAVGAGALLAAVLGTVVTLGATSGSEDPDGQNVTTEQSASEDDGENGLPADEPADETAADEDTAGDGPESPGPSGTASPSTSGSPSPGTSSPGTDPETSASSSGSPSDRPTHGSPSPTKKPTKPPTTPPDTETPSETPTDPESPDPTPSESETTTEPSMSDSASGPAETVTASATEEDSASPTTA